MDEGIASLALTLDSHAKAVSEAQTNAMGLDLGEIQPDYSLLTHAFPVPLMPGQYKVCRQLTLGAADTHLTYTIPAGNPGDGTHSHGLSGPHAHSGGQHGGHYGGTGEHSHSGDGQHVHQNEGPHIHDVLIPEKMRSVKPGDQVLVGWFGNTTVVLDIVLPASVLTQEASHGG